MSCLTAIPFTAIAAQPGNIVVQVNGVQENEPPAPFYPREIVFERLEGTQPELPASETESVPPQSQVAIDPPSVNPPPLSALKSSSNWQSFSPGTDPTRTTPLTLWATHYHVYHAQSIPGGQPLLNPASDRLGPTLSQKDWCYAALQGTVQITNGQGDGVTYNFAGRGSAPQVDCSPFFSSLSTATIQKVNRVRFVVAKAPFGYGTDGLNLVPYRTIAVDRNQIPIGSVLYIPAAKGKVVTLPSGEQVVHDGFFYAADVGSAIKGNHIDVFTGTSKQSPFSFVKSKPNSTFQAFLVQDAEIAQALQSLHRN